MKKKINNKHLIVDFKSVLMGFFFGVVFSGIIAYDKATSNEFPIFKINDSIKVIKGFYRDCEGLIHSADTGDLKYLIILKCEGVEEPFRAWIKEEHVELKEVK